MEDELEIIGDQLVQCGYVAHELRLPQPFFQL